VAINSVRIGLDLAPLDRVGWLANQPYDFRQWVAKVAEWRNYNVGKAIYLAGDQSDGIYGLASGALELTFPLIGDEPVSIYRAEVGFWIGDSAELSDEPRLISLFAASECRMLHIPSRAIRTRLASRPADWQYFFRLSHINVKTAVTLLAETLALTVRARICRRLLKLTEADAEARITHEQLAKFLGLTRTTVTEELRRLSTRGAIDTGYGRIRVLDRSILEAYRKEQ
jgi:CRP/FNR family cyclic AMP-dependent transcriptional regulator